MPRYDYVCPVDGEEREMSILYQNIDTFVVRCQQGHPMRRLLPHQTPFHFRGKFSPEYWGYKEKRSDGLTPLAE